MTLPVPPASVTPDRPLRILGIDPGTRHVGYGLIEKRANGLAFITGGCVHAKGDTIAIRLVTIYRGLSEVIRAHQPDSAAVETVFTGNNPKTAIAIGEGRGVALLSVAEQDIPVQGYAPAMVKRAVTGTGRADKEQMRAMVQVLLCLPEPPETDHEADALALAITHARHCSPVGNGAGASGGIIPAARKKSGRRDIPECILRQLPAGFMLRQGV